MAKLRLTLACWDYDRTRPLMDGRVKPDGIELIYLPLWVQEGFYRMLKHREFDAAEMSLSAYVTSLFTDERPFVAIPVFPSRMFRHRSIFINSDSGIREPKDLEGKRVGAPEFRQTAAVWIRGILKDEYGVDINSITYYTGPIEEPDPDWKYYFAGTDIPDMEPLTNVKVINVRGKVLSKMLEDGELDALFSARIPSCYIRGSPRVRRLFENYVEVEMQYYRRTGIFPIMHVIVIRREIYEKNPWVAASLYKTFLRAKELAYQEMYDKYGAGALKYMLPWMTYEIEEARRLMGRDYWPYGLRANYKTLETFLRYHYEQGLSKRLLKPEELFVPELLDT